MRKSQLSAYWSGTKRDGYVTVDIEILPKYARRYCASCFSWFGSLVQRQIEGLPIGGAFSVFLQRCWAVFRELPFP